VMATLPIALCTTRLSASMEVVCDVN